MTLYRREVRAKAKEVLALQIQGVRVHEGQQWPMSDTQLPALLLDLREESKQGLNGNNGPPAFEVTLTMVVRARAVVTAQAGAALHGVDHGPAAEAVLDAWLERIQDALLSDPDFVRMFKSVPSVRAETQVFTEETMVAEAGVTFSLTWEEVYPPRVTDNFTVARVVVDAIDPADPLGPYPGIAPFPAPADPPRERGPDGRAEAGFEITLPTP